MTITASETGSADNMASFDGELAMHFSSCASTTKEVTATQGMSAIGTQARASKVASIPDPPSPRGHRHPINGTRISSHRFRLVQTGARVPVLSCHYRSIKGLGLAGAGASDPACTLLDAGRKTLDYLG
jgi:hypothetical protein